MGEGACGGPIGEGAWGGPTAGEVAWGGGMGERDCWGGPMGEAALPALGLGADMMLWGEERSYIRHTQGILTELSNQSTRIKGYQKNSFIET